MYDPNPAPLQYLKQPCGCELDPDLGLKVKACPQHDRRDPATRMAALFQQLAMHLEMAAADPGRLHQAAAVCVRLSRAVLGERAAEPEDIA